MVGRAATRRRRASPESGAGSGKDPKDLEVTGKRAKKVKGGVGWPNYTNTPSLSGPIPIPYPNTW